MASLDELEGPSPIQDFISQVIQTVAPKKEFSSPSAPNAPDISAPDVNAPSGPSAPDANAPSAPDANAPAAPNANSPTVDPNAPAAPNANSPSSTNSTGGPDSRADAEARAKDPSTRNKLIAAGVAAAAIVAIIAAALASFIASAGAEIKFNRIVSEPNSTLPLPSFLRGTPTKVDVTWSVRKVKPGGIASAVKLLKTDSVEWHDSTIDTLDGHDVTPTKVKDEKKEFVVESGKSDSSTIDLTDKGYGVIKTTFDAHLDQAVKDAGEGAGNALGSVLDGLTGIGIGGFVMIILAIVFLVIVGPIIFELIGSMLTKKSNTGAKTN
jgi:hypothetical protein